MKSTRKNTRIIIGASVTAGLLLGLRPAPDPIDSSTFILVVEILSIPFAWVGAWFIVSIIEANRRIGYDTGFLRILLPFGALSLIGFFLGAFLRNVWHGQFREEILGLATAVVFYRSFIYLLRNADEHRDAA